MPRSIKSYIQIAEGNVQEVEANALSSEDRDGNHARNGRAVGYKVKLAGTRDVVVAVRVLAAGIEREVEHAVAGQVRTADEGTTIAEGSVRIVEAHVETAGVLDVVDGLERDLQRLKNVERGVVRVRAVGERIGWGHGRAREGHVGLHLGVAVVVEVARVEALELIPEDGVGGVGQIRHANEHVLDGPLEGRELDALGSRGDVLRV